MSDLIQSHAGPDGVAGFVGKDAHGEPFFISLRNWEKLFAAERKPEPPTKGKVTHGQTSTRIPPRPRK